MSQKGKVIEFAPKDERWDKFKGAIDKMIARATSQDERDDILAVIEVYHGLKTEMLDMLTEEQARNLCSSVCMSVITELEEEEHYDPEG